MSAVALFALLSILLAFGLAQIIRTRRERLRARLAAIDAELWRIREREMCGRKSLADSLRKQALEARRVETLLALLHRRQAQ